MARDPRLPGIAGGADVRRLKATLAEAGLVCPKCGRSDYRLEYDRNDQRTGYRVCLRDGTRWPIDPRQAGGAVT